MTSGTAIRILYRTLPAVRRRQAWLTIGLMLLGSLVEVMSVGSILPFLAVLTDPKRLFAVPLFGWLILSLPPGIHLVPLTAIVFISLFIFSGLIRLLLTKVSQALTFNIAHDLSVIGFAKLIRQPYPYYVERHSGEALSQFEKLHTVTFTVLLSGIQALISSVMAVLLIALLVVLNPFVALVSGVVLIGAYLLFSLMVRGLLSRNSIVGSHHGELRVKRVQEALGGIRDILLDRSQAVFEREYAQSSNLIRKILASNSFISMAPRIMIETVGMVMIGAYAWYLSSQPGGVTGAIPILGALALGAQRLLPLLQQSYNGWSNFLGNRQNVFDVVALLELEVRVLPPPGSDESVFNRSVRFARLGFSYRSGGPVLHDIDFTIARGERIGIAGTTGSGKSTLMDLLLGLLEPSEGQILIDDRPLDDCLRAAWQAEIAHVPQAIYLIDDTMAMNIAFGVSADEVNAERVAKAARSAGIADYIDGLPEGYETRTGERGVRLSGGQRQRIGIARALYKNARVLVFDEATSALDTRTEEGVMASIAALGGDITIVMIAHRLTTLKDCDRVIRLEGGRIERIAERGDAMKKGLLG
jgi:ABC-type multidrug transport system fused ATPase/permease subunit